MSLKPKKVSDMNKAWMGARRGKVVKIAPEYHLIVSEGTDTEPLYFQAIKEIINEKYKNRISIRIEGMGDNTTNLFKKAQKIVEGSSVIYKHVWLVYDKDDFPKKYFNVTETKCNINSNEETTYHALWSNQCIELWFLLHYSFLQSDLHRDEYWPKLSDWLRKEGFGEYRKGRADMFEILRPHMDDAIRNAKLLEELNEGKTPSASAPGTKVYKIIEKLKPFLQE